MATQDNWYLTFFNGLALDLWVSAVPQEFTNAEVDFIATTAGLTHGSKLLDMPCGFGRHSIPLAAKGIEVTGIDLAESYIQQIKWTAAEAHLPIKAIAADFLTMSLSDSYHAAICMGNSFSYFKYNKMMGFLRKLCNHIAPKGLLIANTGMLAESILPRLEKSTYMKVGEIDFYIENRYHTDNSVLETQMRFVKGDQSETATAFHFTYTVEEMKRMLLLAGFSSVEVYSGLLHEPYQLGDPQAYLVARKP